MRKIVEEHFKADDIEGDNHRILVDAKTCSRAASTLTIQNKYGTLMQDIILLLTPIRTRFLHSALKHQDSPPIFIPAHILIVL